MSTTTSRAKGAGYKMQRRGSYGKSIIKTFIRNGREWQYHATKGWRNYRATKET